MRTVLQSFDAVSKTSSGFGYEISAASTTAPATEPTRPVRRSGSHEGAAVLVFAYDGTLNGDWVAHYAVRFARHTPERRLRLPMLPQNRSLNLSNSVAVAVYEAWRQLGFTGAI